MDATTDRTVPRPRENPTLAEVRDTMEPCRCYMVADLVVEFSDYDPPRSTVRNRLETLVAEEDVVRQKHANGRVTYRRPQSE